MCFRFGSCFGSGSRQDYGRSASKATYHGYYSGADHKSGPQAYHLQHPSTDDKEVRNAGAGVRKDHVDEAGGEAPKQPASWSGKVGGVADYTHMARLHDAAADHQKEKAATDYHRYPATASTTLARY